MIVMITTFNFHTYNYSSYHTKKNLIKNLGNFSFKKTIFFTFSLPPEHSTLFHTNYFKVILEEFAKFHLKLKIQFSWPRGLFYTN